MNKNQSKNNGRQGDESFLSHHYFGTGLLAVTAHPFKIYNYANKPGKCSAMLRNRERTKS
jgi:hypothetical protein